MPDLWLDVDTALTEVPVNILALTDDTDFTTREATVPYNAAGMDLVWNFVTSAGVFTQTAVTPTTAGDYDWTHQGDAMYTIEIPASGGASINNDTEGYGWFTGVCTGVLHWRGPTIGFRAAGLNDALCDSAYSTTRGLAGTALPAAAADAAGGLPISDAGALDLDTILGRITANVALASVCTEARLAELDAANIPANIDTLLTRIVGTLAAGTHNPQSGDAFARLGAPAGASVSADIAAVDTAIGALNNISTAEVLTQVNAALDTAISELGVAAPTATPTLRTGLMLLYMMARNRVDVDTTGTDALKIYNDAGTQICSKAITDDGTDYSEAEMT